MLATTTATDGLLNTLGTLLGTDGLITDLAEREHYSSDLHARGATCLAVLRPRSVEALAQAVAACAEADCAIHPRGGGVGYVEAYTPQHEHSVVLDTAQLNKIVEINPDDMYITVEAGVTWKQIYEALLPLGLRLPFFGTFSGAQSTVGGGLSQGASFLATARYGGSAEIVLALEVCLADGSLVHTGHSVVAGAKPVFRAYGPDMTGVFTHDCGTLGVKTRITLRMIRAPKETDFLSFGFTSAEDAIRALCEVGRAEVAEDASVLDPIKNRNALSGSGLSTDLKVLASVASSAGGLLKGIRASANIALAGRKFADGFYALNLTIARANAEALKADMKLATQIARDHGGELLPDSIPRATRAYLFPPLNGVVGGNGERWSAVNAKVAHSQAVALDARTREIVERNRDRLDAHGIIASQMFSVAQNHVFSYEISFNWHDEWLPLHHSASEPDYLRKWPEPKADVAARTVVEEVRQEVVDLFAEFHAASNQIGKTYPYLSLLDGPSRALLQAFKATVDPRGVMNPGALEFA